MAPVKRNGVTATAPATTPARSAAHTAQDPAPALTAAPAGDSPAAAVLAALAAHSGGAAITVLAGQAGISVPAVRQALIAHEKAGTVTRVKASRPGQPDTWKPAPDEPVPVPAGTGTPAEGTGGPVGTGQAVPAGENGDAGAAPGPDPALTAEAAASVQAITQAAEAAGTALAAEDLPAAGDQAARGRRLLTAAARGRRGPTTRPGGLRDLVAAHLRQFPETAFTPHQIAAVLTRSSGAVANALDKLVSLGTAELAGDKPRRYQFASAVPGPDAAGDPGTSTQTTASAA